MFLNNDKIVLTKRITINKLFDNKCYLKYNNLFQ